MSDDDLWEPREQRIHRDREREELYRGAASGSAIGFRSPPQTLGDSERRQEWATQSAAALLTRLRRARTIPELVWASTTFREERSFAKGVAAGMLGVVVVEPFDLIRMFVFAELYETLDGPWRHALRSARALPGPLGKLAFTGLLGSEYAALSSLLRESYEERERLIEQLDQIVAHPLRFLADLPESVANALKGKWVRYQTLRAQHDVESQYQAGVIFGELVAEVLMVAIPVGKAAMAKLQKELPDLFKQIEKRRPTGGGPGEGGFGGGSSGGGGEGASYKSEGGGSSPPPSNAPSAPKAPAPQPAPSRDAPTTVSQADKAVAAAPAEAAASEAEAAAAAPDAPNGQPLDKTTATADPVDVASGKMFTNVVDCELPGLLGFRWERVWFSTSTHAGALGHGWHHTYCDELHVERDAVRYHTSDGRIVSFPALAPGHEHFDRTERLSLRRDASGYSLRTRDQQVLRFAARQDGASRQPLQAITDPTGRSIQLHRDEAGQLRELIDGAGRSVAFKHDARGRITSIRVPHPDGTAEPVAAVRYDYDSVGNLVKVGDALGQAAAYRYQDHQLVQHTNRNGLSFYFEYDGTGPRARCVHTWGDDGIYDHKLSYDVARGITIVENSLGAKTLYEHRGGLVVRTVDPFGAVTLSEYDEHSDKCAETDALGQQTRFFYDERGNLSRVIRPDGVQVRALHDERGLLKTVQEGNGASWRFEYDDVGRLIERIDPVGAKTRYRYSGACLSEIVDAAGEHFSMSHDAQGNVLAARAPDGSERRWEYDALGRVRAAVDAAGNVQRITRDLLGRATRVHETDGNVRQLSYDAEGRLVRVQDKHRDVQQTYQGLGLLASRREAGTTVYFDYDTEERLSAIHNEQGRAYRFERGLTGEIEAEYGLDRVRRGYRRDLLGRVIEQQLPNGATSRYSYDAMGRVLEVRHSDGGFERYAYAEDGNLIQADNESCTLRFESDALGRVSLEVRDQHWIRSEYDRRGRRARVRSSLGLDQRIGHDALGRVKAVSAGAFEARIARDAMGLEIERALPGGARSQWQRDALGRPIRHDLVTEEQVRRSTSYGWDADARLLQLIDTDHGLVRYGYDPRGRTSWARYVDGTAELRMPDEVANLYRSEDRSDRVYGAAGELLEAKGRRGRVTKYRYDPNGNLVEKLEPGQLRWQFHWNAAGRLARVERPDGSEVEFRYDAFGRRIQKRHRGQTTHFLWDGDVPLHEWVEGQLEPLAPSRSLPANTDYHIRQREAELQAHLAQGPPERGSADTPITWLFEPDSHIPMARLAGDQCHAILTDYLGTPVALIDNQATLTWSATITTYGDLHRLKGRRQACPFRWQGQYEDAETGLHYNRHRYYDPQLGAYISQDPLGVAGGLELYGYCKDPLTWVDPLGLCGTAAPSTNAGVLDNANFAQKSYNPKFSQDGNFSGKTVDEVADALKAGAMKPSEVPIDYVVRDGNTLILNTRSAHALQAAEIPRSQWTAVNRSGQQQYEDMLSDQLTRNKLTSAGTPTARWSGGR